MRLVHRVYRHKFIAVDRCVEEGLCLLTTNKIKVAKTKEIILQGSSMLHTPLAKHIIYVVVMIMAIVAKTRCGNIKTQRNNHQNISNLLDNLLRGYDNSVRPDFGGNSSLPSNINFIIVKHLRQPITLSSQRN